jgi:thymidylate synthase (FAD)
MLVKFHSSTPNAEETMAYIARVSNPNNQDNPDFEGLMRYCIQNHHWSVFEQSHMTVEINTNLAIATHILRHRSFTFQQFSQRYADVGEFGEIPVQELRRQDTKNRQNSTDDLDRGLVRMLETLIQEHFESTTKLYRLLLSNGVAKECARFVLPQATPTRLYMTGTCRSWIHYIELRTAHGTQKEHVDVADAVKRIFCSQFPTVAKALGWPEKELMSG